MQLPSAQQIQHFPNPALPQGTRTLLFFKERFSCKSSWHRAQLLPSTRGFLTPLPALSVLFLTVWSFLHSPLSCWDLGSALPPLEPKRWGKKHIWVVLQMCSTHSCAVDMGRCGPGQFGTTFSASILTSPEVFQCHSSGFSLIQQNSEALGVKHMFWP